MSARGVMAGYGVGFGGLVVAVLALPVAWSVTAWYLVGLLATGAVVIGVLSHRPRPRWPWSVLGAGLVVLTAADLLDAAARTGAGQPAGLYLLSNLGYLIGFFGAAAAAVRFARGGRPNADGAALADALTITVLLVICVWVLVVTPSAEGIFVLTGPVPVGHLVGDGLLLAAMVRLLAGRRPTPATLLLVVGAAAGLLADVVAGLADPGPSGVDSPVAVVLWLLRYGCWGAAALHPGMARLTGPEPRPAPDRIARQLVVVVAAALGAPAILLVEAFGGVVRDGAVLAVGSVALFLLSLARVASTANTHRRSLAYREHHDTLTGLANRSYFSQQLAAELERGPGPAVLLVDLDEFKLVNDTMGQSAGDEVLLSVARRITRSLGRHDLAARFGGDEFAVLVTNAHDPREVDDAAARIAAALAEPISFNGRDVRITASIGVAGAGPGDTGRGHRTLPDPEPGTLRPGPELLSQASLALQAARTEGPGRWCRYDEDVHGQLVERRKLRAALTRAVHDGEFTLSFQPIVALAEATTVGFEALLRWSHPTRGPIPPEEFIDVAEETGLIESIGDWVLWRAVAMAAHWHRSAPPGPYISVNVSARQFRNPGFAERVARALHDAGLPPSHLMIELTESVLLREADDVWAELAALRDTGVRLAIDDFGTGFSTLTYLLQTPIDVIKIDKSFVSTLTTSARHHGVVEGIVHLAHTLGLQVVAEGIEIPAHRDILTGMGCPFGQGFLYSVPLTSTEANRWLALEADLPGSEYVRSGASTPGPGTLPA